MSSVQRKLLLIVLMASVFTTICDAGRIHKRRIKKLFKHSVILNDHFTGFELYDLDNQRPVFERNADKYFTPASNTKLFTFYTCLKMLGNSIPGLKYTINGDSLLLWGTGDPSFLHPDLKALNVYQFLKQTDKKIYFCAGQYQNDMYGAGWAWDDYNDYYQAEISELPLYGNTVDVYTGADGMLHTRPAFFERFLQPDTGMRGSFSVRRDFHSNRLYYPATLQPPARFRQTIPWQTGTDLTVKLLSDTLKKDIFVLKRALPPGAQTINSVQADTLYRHMLQPSDNFMAEQLLLVCSSVKFGYLNTDSVRQYSLQQFLNDLPDKPEWHDGSGLSRRNLFTPRDIIVVLNKILAEVKDEQLLHSLLPTGGVTGTIRTAYKTDNGVPFAWAKTGSLSNNYNQSGYLVTRKGRRLAFSFMNNNFTDATHPVRDEMVRIITYIHENF